MYPCFVLSFHRMTRLPNMSSPTMEELRRQVNKLAPWYQAINLGGVWTRRSGPSSLDTWRSLRRLLPSSLEGCRILDLGCNAGLFCIEAGREGAIVVGLDRSAHFIKQALFIRKCLGAHLSIQYRRCDLATVDFLRWGRFDCVLALSVLHHVGRDEFDRPSDETEEVQKRVVRDLTKCTRKVIVRCRQAPGTSSRHFDRLFTAAGFRHTAQLQESGSRSMVVYQMPLA